VQLRDQFGNAVEAGREVSLSGPNLAGTVTTTTNESGMATLVPTASTTANYQAYTATVTSSDADGATVSTTWSLTTYAGAPATITASTPLPMSSTVATAYASFNLVVKDTYGNTISGTQVSFAIPGSGATLTGTPSTVTTNSSGVATVRDATASTTASVYGTTFSLTSTSGTFSTSFALENVPAAPYSIIGGKSLSAVVSSTFATLSSTVVDLYNNPVWASTTVYFTSTAATNGATASFSDASKATTYGTGTVTTTATANNIVGGSYSAYARLTSAASTLSSTTFNLTNTTGSVNTIEASLSSTPQTTPVNTEFPVALKVTVRDGQNALLSGATVTFTVNASSSTAGAQLGAATATTTSDGTASVTSTANGVAGDFTVSASTPGAASAATFNLTNSALPTHTVLDITQRTLQPGEVVHGTVTVTSTTGQPSGWVVLLNGTTALGRATVTDGTGTATGTAPTQSGDYVLTAQFLGALAYTSSQSAPVTITVTGGVTDAGVDATSDASTSDAGVDATSDASTLDAGVDATSDASTLDAGVDATPDTGTPDTGTPDTGKVDSGTTLDSGTVVDSGGSDAARPPSPSSGDSSGCQTGPQPVSSSGFALLALGAAAFFRGRRKVFPRK
jgi:MYXO-CTERM domain-containing protein